MLVEYQPGKSHTWCTRGENCRTASRTSPTPRLIESGVYDGGNVEKHVNGFALKAWTIVAILFAALYGSLDATMSLTTARPSKLRPDTLIAP